jgi:hypothetical protein
VLVDVAEVGISRMPDYTKTADAVIATMASESCPICRKKSPGDAVVHTACRQRLLALLAEKPFTKPRNAAYQNGLCTCCATRPHLSHRIVCAECDQLVRRVKEENPV